MGTGYTEQNNNSNKGTQFKLTKHLKTKQQKKTDH